MLLNVPLRVMLTAEQKELIGQAAALENGGDVSAWARPILVRAAQAALAERESKKPRQK